MHPPKAVVTCARVELANYFQTSVAVPESTSSLSLRASQSLLQLVRVQVGEHRVHRPNSEHPNQLPCRPNGTRKGNSTVAIGPAAISCASSTTQSLTRVFWSVRKVT